MEQITTINKIDSNKFIKNHFAKLAVLSELSANNNLIGTESSENLNILKKDATYDTTQLLNNVSICNTMYPLLYKGYNSDSVTSVTPVTVNNTNVQNNNEIYLEIFDERAAIIEYEANIPKCWAEAIAKIQLKTKPNSISIEKWHEIQVVLEMLSLYLEDIICYNWNIKEIFGCHPTAPQIRFDMMGLLILLKTVDTIIEVTANVIRIQNKNGATSSFYRPYYKRLIGWSYLYDIN